MIFLVFWVYDYSLSVGFLFNVNQWLQVSWWQSFGCDILYVGLMMDIDFDDVSVFFFDYKV